MWQIGFSASGSLLDECLEVNLDGCIYFSKAYFLYLSDNFYYQPCCMCPCFILKINKDDFVYSQGIENLRYTLLVVSF